MNEFKESDTSQKDDKNLRKKTNILQIIKELEKMNNEKEELIKLFK